MIANKTKGAILRRLSYGETAGRIAFDLETDVETVKAVEQAQRTVTGLRKHGVDPNLLYANFGDLLTREACGARG